MSETEKVALQQKVANLEAALERLGRHDDAAERTSRLPRHDDEEMHERSRHLQAAFEHLEAAGEHFDAAGFPDFERGLARNPGLARLQRLARKLERDAARDGDEAPAAIGELAKQLRELRREVRRLRREVQEIREAAPEPQDE